MPNRILKDSVCTSDNLDHLTAEQEVFWYRLLVQCDDYGRMDARPAILRARCYPLRLGTVSEQDVADWLTALVAANLVRVYEVAGKPYLQVTTWDRHQQVRAKRSKYPPMIADDSIGNHLLSDDRTCTRNPIQSNPNRESESLSNAPLAQDDADISPEVRAIRNAYDACGLMFSKSHQDAHLETIKRTGLPAWQLGFAEALKAGKHNVPKYVARCAESAMLTAQKGNGNGRTDTSRGFGLTSLTTDADRAYHASNTPEAIAKLQAEWDAS
jgi:hypothetical protein